MMTGRAALALAAAGMLLGALPVPRAPSAGRAARPSPEAAARGREALRRALAVLGVPAARRIADGSGMTVALIDTGVDKSVRALRGRVLSGYDVRTHAGADTDAAGHGTAMAGLIAGRGVAGVDGVAPGARILPVRVAFGPTVAASDVAAGLHWAVGRAQVVVLPYAPGYWSNAVQDAVAAVAGAGAIVVVSAGNRGLASAPVPSAALAVGATDRHGSLEPYSGRPGANGVVAPGGDADPSGWRLLTVGPRGTLHVDAGSSVSAALVGGVAALVRGAAPSGARALECLRKTADTGAAGRDDAYGWGAVRADKAASCARARGGGGGQ